MSDYRHPPVRKLNSTIPVDVIRVKSYVNSPLILREWQWMGLGQWTYPCPKSSLPAKLSNYGEARSRPRENARACNKARMPLSRDFSRLPQVERLLAGYTLLACSGTAEVWVLISLSCSLIRSCTAQNSSRWAYNNTNNWCRLSIETHLPWARLVTNHYQPQWYK